jgi:transposase InsO family protein
MLSILSFLLSVIFNLLKTKKSLLLQICLYKKELEILKRQNQKKRLHIKYSDRVIFSVLNKIDDIRNILSIVKPETILLWQKKIIKRFWTFKVKKRVGRPPVKEEIKQTVLNMKNDSLNWGYKKIQGELIKIGINLDQKTIRNILNDFRRKGKVKKSLTWKKFLKLQIHSIYAMDFFTIDTILNQRLYVLFILCHKTREILQYAITSKPTREFVRQQLIEFEQKVNQVVYMIHDHAAQFNINYLDYGIKSIKTSVEAPNMNAIAERFVGSVRREALDFYILINEKQVQKILDEYIYYYNSKRPHQGIDQRIPRKYQPHLNGKVQKLPILGGLHHHYFRRAA